MHPRAVLKSSLVQPIEYLARCGTLANLGERVTKQYKILTWFALVLCFALLTGCSAGNPTSEGGDDFSNTPPGSGGGGNHNFPAPKSSSKYSFSTGAGSASNGSVHLKYTVGSLNNLQNSTDSVATNGTVKVEASHSGILHRAR